MRRGRGVPYRGVQTCLDQGEIKDNWLTFNVTLTLIGEQYEVVIIYFKFMQKGKLLMVMNAEGCLLRVFSPTKALYWHYLATCSVHIWCIESPEETEWAVMLWKDMHNFLVTYNFSLYIEVLHFLFLSRLYTCIGNCIFMFTYFISSWTKLFYLILMKTNRHPLSFFNFVFWRLS